MGTKVHQFCHKSEFFGIIIRWDEKESRHTLPRSGTSGKCYSHLCSARRNKAYIVIWREMAVAPCIAQNWAKSLSGLN